MSIETYSQHPLAQAIVKYGAKEHIHPVEIEQFQSVTGKGAEGDHVDGTEMVSRKCDWISSISTVSVK